MLCFTRRDAIAPRDETVLVVCNFTPVPRHDYRLGAPRAVTWRELLNSDAESYGGSGQGNLGASSNRADADTTATPHSLNLTLPPLAVMSSSEHDETEPPVARPEAEGPSRS